MNINFEILNEEIIYKSKTFKRVRRWVKGMYPDLGVIINGFTGFETVIDQDIITPSLIVKIN